MDYNNIGKFIQEKRKEKGLTQKELANILGVTDKAVSKWERGLGCPDVSLLETLGHTLNVTILEILKGRKIENNQIKENEYIEETIKYTKNNIKNTINKIIIFITISLTFLLLILNIENIISMNKKYEYNFDSKYQEKIKEKVKQIEKNTNIIKKNKGKYEKDDYEKICKILETNLDKIKNIKLINEIGTKKYSLKEIYMLDLDQINIINEIELIKTIEKNSDDKLLQEVITDSLGIQQLLGENTLLKSYEYKLINTTKKDYQLYYNNALYIRTIKLKSTLNTYLYITEQIKKVGEINE